MLCRDGVRQDPEFRAKFHAMCANVGVDPLASNKGVWAQLLGFGDFYYELGVQIVEACLATRAYNGGLMDLPALRRYVQASLLAALTHAAGYLCAGWSHDHFTVLVLLVKMSRVCSFCDVIHIIHGYIS